MTLGQWILLFVILASCVFLILVILVQRGRGEGLAGAFGGGGGGSAFGAKTGDVFTGITVGLAGLFLLLNVAGNYVFLPPEPDTAGAVRPAPPSAPAPVQAPETDTPAPKPEASPVPAESESSAGDTPSVPSAERGAAGGGDVKTSEGEAGEKP